MSIDLSNLRQIKAYRLLRVLYGVVNLRPYYAMVWERAGAYSLTVGGDETAAKLSEVFGERPEYADIPGLCKAATIAEIEAQGWSLNPGRYVGVAPGEAVSDEDFKAQLEALNEELDTLNAQARTLEQTIAANVAGILEG